MVADEDADLAGLSADAFDGPRRGPSDLPIVEPDIVDLAGGGELGDQTEDGDAALLQRFNGLSDQGVHGGDDADGVAFVPDGNHLGRYVLGRKLLEKFHPYLEVGVSDAPGRRSQSCGE